MDSIDTERSDKQREVSPPYVAYKTFRNFIDSLRIGMPGRIDRSVMHTMSGGAQSHIMHALRSMDLISKHGIPTDSFKELVNADGEQRKPCLLSAIKKGYPFLFDGSIDLSAATGKQLLERFNGVPLSGNTVRRAVAFFLAAAKDAGVHLSPYFNKIQSRSGTPVKRVLVNDGRLADVVDEAEDIDQENDLPPKGKASTSQESGESLTINLQSGGTLTVSASTSFFKMSAEDRVFVFDIIDRLQKYAAAMKVSVE